MWIGEEAWGGLLSYWDTQKFKEKSSQNKLISLRLGVEHCTCLRINHTWIVQMGRQGNGTSKDYNGTSKGGNEKSSYNVHQLEDDPRMVKEQIVVMMEQQCDDAFTATSQVHPHYAKDDDHHPLP